MTEIIAHFNNVLVNVLDENKKLAALSHNFRGRKKILQFNHFHQFCFNFIGKDEVFHDLLFGYILVSSLAEKGLIMKLLLSAVKKIPA